MSSGHRHSVSLTRRRDLYDYDVRCSAELNGFRDVDFSIERFFNTGYHSNITSSLPPSTSTKATYAYGLGSATPASWALMRPGATNQEMVGLSQAGGQTSFSQPSYNGVHPAIVQAEHLFFAGKRRVFHTRQTNLPYLTSNHRVRHYRYDNNSTGSPAYESSFNMLHCISGVCNSTMELRSAEPISHTFDFGYSELDVFGWLDQRRNSTNCEGDHHHHREIAISAGFYIDPQTLWHHDSVVSAPFRTGLYSATAPTIACGPYLSAAGFRDCILAYVPMDSTTGQVELRYFYVTSGQQQTGISFSAVVTTPPGVYTNARVALWYHEASSTWMMAWNDWAEADRGKRFRAASSTDGGETWATVTERDEVIGHLFVSTFVNSANNTWARLGVARAP